MAGIFDFLFGGKYPSTSKYEKSTDQRASEYKRFLEFADSDTYKRYLELDELIHTGEFEKRVHTLKTEKFKDTDAYRKWQDYKTLLNNTEIKDYLKFIQTGKAAKLDRILQSASFIEFQNLSILVESKDFMMSRKEKDFKKSEGYTQLMNFKKLKRSSDVRFAQKVMNSLAYKNYKSLLGSDRIKHFESLQAYINSPDFIDLKKEIEDPRRFKKSEEYQLLSEFESLGKNKDLVWYQKMKANNAFAEEAKWRLTFEEDFDRAQLNTAKWITGYYWGKALLNDTYVLANEKQFFNPANIEIRDSIAHLITRPEQCKGKVWDATRGFFPKDFEYSSALISTGQSFRQQYGKFEAKIKVSHDQPLNHNFWMVAESIAPQIDILKYGTANHKTVVAGTQLLKNNMPQQLTKAINGASFNSDFYIYSLEWTPKKMVWRINGVEVHTQTNDIPDQSMYLVFSSNMTETPAKELRSEMAIDWVRCYQINE